MNQAAKSRLQAAVNRLVLQKSTIARDLRGKCCFCNCNVQAQQPYQASGNLIAHADCVRAVGNELRHQKPTPTGEQIEALRLFAAANGRKWKSALRTVWENGAYERAVLGGADPAPLQQVRNTFGPTWLIRFSFHAYQSQLEQPK